MLHFRTDDKKQEIAVTISTGSFIRIALLTAASIAIFISVKKAEHILALIFVAFILALALNTPVNWVSQHLPGRIKGSRSFATTLSFLIVVIVLGTFLSIIVPPLVRQTGSLIKAAPHILREFHNQKSPIGSFIRHHNLEGTINNISNQLSKRLTNIGGTAFSTAKTVGSSIFSVLVILVTTFMMLVEGPRWIDFFKQLLPDHHHSLAERLSHDMYMVIRGYANGQVIMAAIAALVISPVIVLLHIGYPAGLVVVIFICALIPMIGHTIGAIIVTLVALFHSTTSAIIILAYYILYMQIEAYIIQPRIQSNTTKMSPLLVFISVIIGVSFDGIFGGILAIPVAGCLRIAILEYLRSKNVIDNKEFRHVTSLDTK